MRIQVKVKPSAKQSQLLQQGDGTWLAHVKAPPVDGKANAELIKLVAEQFNVARSSVSIKCGAGSKLKLVDIGQ